MSVQRSGRCPAACFISSQPDTELPNIIGCCLALTLMPALLAATSARRQPLQGHASSAVMAITPLCLRFSGCISRCGICTVLASSGCVLYCGSDVPISTGVPCNQVNEREQKQWCSANFVNGRALRKAVDIHTQLSAQLSSDTMPSSRVAVNGDAQHSGNLRDVDSSSADAEATIGLRRALTAGLAVHGAMRQPDGES
jgi:hypothetical protein